MSTDRVRWDSGDYARNSQAQRGWGQELIQKLELRGEESVLDIGCGDGRLTSELAARVPRGEVVGVDSSPDMVERARGEFPEHRNPNLHFEVMDARFLSFPSRFDVAFSNAALHWVKDAPAVLRGVSRALRPAGRLLFQMGGRGNAARIMAVAEEIMRGSDWRQWFEGFESPWGFWGPEEYRPWCERAGLSVGRIELVSKDMATAGGPGLVAWLRTTWMPYTARLPESRRAAFLQEIADAYAREFPANQRGELVVPMVRLEVEAMKVSGPGPAADGG